MIRDTREHILEVAFLLFMQKGVKGVSMNDIVAKSGFSKGAIYHYFVSKEKIFEEVMYTYYQNLLSRDLQSFSLNSLKEYYHDFLDDAGNRYFALQDISKKYKLPKDFKFNYYYLIFDAITLLPSFVKANKENDELELKQWEKIIGIARKKGEIKTKLTDKQIAEMFFYLGDGYGMNVMKEPQLRAKKESMITEIKALYDNLYSLLKS